LLTAALEQGNIFAAMDLRTRLNLIWLAADDPNGGRAEVIEALKVWPHEGFHLQHYTSMHALAQIELYTGDAEVAWKHIQGQWKALEQSMLLRIQVLRIEAMHLQARAALATAAGSNDKKHRLKVAGTMAKRIAKEKIAWAQPFASLVRAGIAHQEGESSKAVNFLSEAVENFDLADIDLYAAATRHRLGELLGNERGRQLIAEAENWMLRQEIKDPAAMIRMLTPGFD
ncbi:MAG: serine/threonine-protein kinase PknK, partial [Pyrinomonadaceae bacterium]